MDCTSCSQKKKYSPLSVFSNTTKTNNNIDTSSAANGFHVKKFKFFKNLRKRERERERMTFKIPLTLSDLENSDDDSLSVNEIVDMSSEESIRTAWKSFQNRLKNEGVTTMSNQESFDLTYALVSYVKKCRDLSLTCKMCTCITNAFSCFVTTSSDHTSSQKRSALCDSIRASVYFSKNLVDVILSCEEFTSSSGKKTKNTSVNRAVRTLNQLVDGLTDILSGVTRFWECGVPEDSFLMLFLKISQRILSVEMTVSNKSAAASVAHLLAFLVHTFPSTSTSLSVSLQELVLAHSFSCSAVVRFACVSPSLSLSLSLSCTYLLAHTHTLTHTHTHTHTHNTRYKSFKYLQTNMKTLNS